MNLWIVGLLNKFFFGENLSKVWTSVIFILCQIIAIE